MAKPVVDRLERDLSGTAQVLRLNITSDTGRAAAVRYGVRAVPTFVILDVGGAVVAQSSGLPNGRDMQEILESLSPRTTEGNDQG